MKKLVILIAALSVPAAAHAYLLSAGAILHKMGAHRRNLQLSTLVVKGELTFQGAEATTAAKALGMPEDAELTAPVTILYKLPGKCRIELRGADGKEGPAVSNVNGKLSVSGPALPSLRAFANYACPLLDGRGGYDGPADLAKEAGVSASKVTLGRTEGVVAYVIGAHPRDVAIPSIWVEKDRFEPLRLVAKEGDSFLEMRLIDYSSAIAGEWHPRVVEIRKGSEQAARFVLDAVEANAKVSDVVF